MEQAEQDRVLFTKTVLKYWPEIVTEGALVNLYQIEGIEFYGPFVLFAFAQVRDDSSHLSRIPMHVFVPKDKMQDARKVLQKYVAAKEQTDDHMLHREPYESYRFACGNCLFLSSEFGVTSFIDIYNVTFNPKRGFEGTEQQQQMIAQKKVHIDPRLAKQVLQTVDSIRSFFSTDCKLLAHGFSIDWDSQKWWRHVWKTALRHANFDIMTAFERITWEQASTRQLTHPLLAIAVKSGAESRTISNSIFGCVFLSFEGFHTKRFLERPFVAWETVAHSLDVITVQIGEFLPSDIANQKTLMTEEGPVFIDDLLKHEGQKQLPSYTLENARQLVRCLGDNKNTFAVFFIQPETNVVFAFCRDFKEVKARKVYTCSVVKEGTIVHTQKEYWELNINDHADKPIIIENHNWTIFQRKDTRYFILIELRTRVMVTDAAAFDLKQDIGCEPLRSVSGLMSVKVSKNTNVATAVDKIFKQMTKKHAPSSREQDSDTETEATYSSSSEMDSEDERRVINEQHNPE